MPVLVSIRLDSNRPENSSGLTCDLEATGADPACLEVLIKIVDGDEAMRQTFATRSRTIL